MIIANYLYSAFLSPLKVYFLCSLWSTLPTTRHEANLTANNQKLPLCDSKQIKKLIDCYLAVSKADTLKKNNQANTFCAIHIRYPVLYSYSSLLSQSSSFFGLFSSSTAAAIALHLIPLCTSLMLNEKMSIGILT